MPYCKHIILNGKRKGQYCNKKVNSQYCKPHKRINEKYQKSIVTRDKNLGDLKHVGDKKLRYSYFNITLNYQKNYYSLTEEEKNIYKKFTYDLFKKHRLLKFMEDKHSNDIHRNIETIKSNYIFEVGKKFLKLHVHGYYRIVHTSHLTLYANKLRDYAYEKLGYNIHVNIKPHSNHNKNWESYMRKNLEGEKVSL